ncbi:MAG: glycosyltransferase family 4 protein [Verrucomicrobiota bacterium]
MRICLFTPTFFPKMGGQEMVVNQLALHYTSLGHEIVVFAQHARRRGTQTETKVPYALKRFTKPFSQVWGIAGIRRALADLHKSWPIEIIHSHSCYPTGFAALDFCRCEHIPLVITSHGGDLAEDSRFRSRPIIMKRCRQALEQADAVTFISSYMRKSILEVAPNCDPHLHSIPNGVDCGALTEKIPPPSAMAEQHILRTDSFVLFLGRLHQRKGVDVLIKAFERAAEQNPVLRLVIAGEGEEQVALREQAGQSRVVDRIHFLGTVQGPNKLWLLQNACCLVLPTRTRETFGLVLLEAMACGKPVIATRLGGILDLVKEGQNGLLVNPDDVDDLARALIEIGKPALHQALSKNCLATARQYDWPQVASQYLALFKSLLVKDSTWA